MRSRYTYKSILLTLLSILWMGVIFWFSSKPAVQSSELSGWLREYMIHALESLFHDSASSWIINGLLAGDHIIRKTGHVIEFFLLGLLWLQTMKSLASAKPVQYSFLICALYAMTDEFHQKFVPGRGPLVTDVLLDSAAALAAILIVSAIWYNRGKRRTE